MTQRERSMLLVVVVIGAFVVLFGGFVFANGLLNDLGQKDELIARLESDQRTHELKLLTLAKAQRQLEQWKAISLPPDAGLAGARYRQFLVDLARKHDLIIKQQPLAQSGMPLTNPRSALILNQSFSLTAEGTLARLIGFLREFYSINLAHQVKSVTFTAIGSGPDTRVAMALSIETMTLPNAPNRDQLMPTPDPRLVALEVVTGLKHGPIGIALGPWTLSPHGLHGNPKLAGAISDRDYTRLVAKNVFAGIQAQPTTAAKPPPEPDPGVLRFVFLTDITGSLVGREATLWNRRTNRHTRLRADGGFDSFDVRDANDLVVLRGKVERIVGRDVIFKVGDQRYAIHINESLKDALEKTLSDEDLKRLLEPPVQATGAP